MDPAASSLLTDRALLTISGTEAAHFLGRVVTNDVDTVLQSGAGFGALLSAQGKIVADFLMVRLDDGLLLDCPAIVGADLLKKLTLYKLRADVRIEDVTAAYAIVTNAAASESADGVVIVDPRHPDLGTRHYRPKSAAISGSDEAYHHRRILLGIPELGSDYAPNDLFPHDVALDQFNGVAFTKGCYVGQEVVSRMEHRGTARRRPVCVSAASAVPPRGTPVTADGKVIGELGSSAGTRGIAILRLDRAADARRAGTIILAADIALDLALPAYARYDWPADIAD